MIERGEVAELLAPRPLGLAPTAHAQLDEPPTRLRVRGPRSRRLHDHAGDRRLLDRLRQGDRRPGAIPQRGDVGPSGTRRTGTRISSPRRTASGDARTLVLASGPYNRPDVPPLAARLPPSVSSISPADYRNPDQLADGGVLVVGAAATGVQLADEIHRSGRPVTLAVGGHVRTPRVYRGKDIMWWLDAAGVLDERYDEVDDIVRARHVPSFQLVGSPTRTTVDLNTLQGIGVRLVGKFAGITDDGKAQFSGSLPNQCALADLKLGRLLATIDDWATPRRGARLSRAARTIRTHALCPSHPPLMLSLRSGEIKTVLWATGYRSDYPWLHIPILDPKGNVRHDGGVTAAPGVYLIGGPFLRRRKSTLIDGAGDDARDLTEHLVGYLNGDAPQVG